MYNIKRRVASLPPISSETFNTQIEKRIEITEASTNIKSNNTSSDEEISDHEAEESASPFQCLFCNQTFATDDAGFDTNLEHMLTAHGMSIPDPELMGDMQSFVEYLATEVRVWHECLYCGAMKHSTQSIQSHMRDKGHCLLNLDREPELLEFWESRPSADEAGTVSPEQGQPTDLSVEEIRFASGKTVESKHAALASKKASRRRNLATETTLALHPGPEAAPEEAESSDLTVGPQVASGQQLARREEMSLLGVSVQQRQALVLAEKKAQRSEAVARRAREWVYAKGANCQKFDQIDGKRKHGKQNHKLQPR